MTTRSDQEFLKVQLLEVQEYERFSEIRRSAIEAEAEQDLMRELEDTAKKLPKNLDR